MTAATYWDQLLSWKTLRVVCLFNHSNISHPSLEVVYLFCYRKNGNHPFFEVYCAVFIRCTTFCHSLSLIVICCHSLPLVVIRCHSLYHSLSFVVPLVVIRCHSLSFVVTRCTTRCHSLSFVVTRCTTRCHSLSLDVPLVCLFINDPMPSAISIKLLWKDEGNLQENKHVELSAISIKLENNFTEITLRHGCSPVSLLDIFRTRFLKNTFGRLLLEIFKNTFFYKTPPLVASVSQW